MKFNLAQSNAKVTVIAAIAALVLMSGIPLAMANPDPGIIGSPVTIVAGTDTNIVISAVGGGAHKGTEVTVYDQAAAPQDNDSCPVDKPGAGGNVPATVSAWQLRNTADTQYIRYFLPAGASLSVPFGSLTAGSNTVVTGLGGAKFTTDGSDPLTSGTATTSPVSAKWVPVAGGPIVPANTDRVGLYRVATCGVEPPPQANPATPMEAIGAFETTLQVAGEILSINTSALLLAGLSTSAVWMLPTVGAVVGTGVAVYKLRKN